MKLPRRPVLLALAALLALALGAGGLFAGRRALYAHRAVPEDAPEVLVELPRGVGVRAVAATLAGRGVVDHPRLFALAAWLRGDAGRIRAGEYALSPGKSYAVLLDDLVAGRVVLHQLAVPEGLTLLQIADRLDALGLAERDEVLELSADRDFLAELKVPAASLEGYLFPDTYRFERTAGARRILATLNRRFWEEGRKLGLPAEAGGLSLHQVVTLASIVEREARLPEERPRVAAVYRNRLRKGMKLQADPTVIYGADDFRGDLTRAQLERDTPYNTYTRTGLPPGPICSPGGESLKAALSPAEVPFLYFVAKGDGSHYFSRDYAEHQQAVNRFQRRR